MNRILIRSVLAAMLMLMLILSACGGGSSSSTTTAKITMTEFAFTPKTLTVPAGKEITLTVTNAGAVAHDFVIMKLGQDIPAQGHFGDAERANAFWEQQPVEAGQTVESKFIAPSEPGTYQIVCGVAGHLEAGMEAALVVVAAP